MGFESLRRHPDSGIFQTRKRVPERLKEKIGKTEIKISLRTRDPVVARIRHLEELAKIERAWSDIDASIVDGEGRVLVSLQCKFGAPGAEAVAVQSAVDPFAAGVPPTVAGATAKAPVPLRPLFKSYGKEAQLSHATVKRWSPVIDRLIGHLGHDDAAAISRADVVAWKDALLEGGMKNITVRDVYLAATKALLQFAVDQGLLAENPAKQVKVRVRKKVKEREKGFDGDEATKILAATQGPFSHLISVEMKAARRWLPWIGAYTGARINELTPLTAADLVKRDGIWMIRIRGANAKTRSYREVPLHSHLIEQGLLDYATSRGKRPLFYDPGRTRGAKDSNPHHQKVAERVAEWVRSLGIEGVAPNHGWRHRFSSVARFVAMPADVRNIIQGHAGGKVADDYVVEVVNGFIAQLDGASSREGLICVGASNDLGRCDPAILRPGRLGKIIRINLPNEADLEKMFRVRLGGRLEKTDLSEICVLALGSTGAEVERITNDALRSARHAGRPLALSDLRAAIVGKDERDVADLQLAAIHEAGHIVSEIELFGDEAYLHANIAAIGIRGGYTTRTKAPPFAGTYHDYARRLQVLLAGRAAEELLLGAASHGAGGRQGSDLQVAASMAAGMCASLGIAGKSKLLYLGDFERTDELLSYPEVRAAAHLQLAKAEKAVRALLSERKVALREIADRLLKDKRLDGLTAASILRKHP